MLVLLLVLLLLPPLGLLLGSLRPWTNCLPAPATIVARPLRLLCRRWRQRPERCLCCRNCRRACILLLIRFRLPLLPLMPPLLLLLLLGRPCPVAPAVPAVACL